MKIISLFVSGLFSSIAFSQNNFHNQLKSLVKDSANCFTSFRTGFEDSKGTDSIFNSSVILDGTTKSNLFVTEAVCVHISRIAEAVKKRQGRRIVDEWKSKISAVFDNIFKLTAVKNSNSANYGWNFEYGNLSMSVRLFHPDPQFADYLVDLFIFYHKHPVLQ